jgi:hypothetical protein
MVRVKCPNCLSINYYRENAAADAWECYNCVCRHWLSLVDKRCYCVATNRTWEEADKDLDECSPTLFILSGQMERE